MHKKWYFGTLLTALALLIAIQEPTVVPNQEIVLEFTNSDVDSPEVQNAITIVKKQLQSIGVKNTRISRELKNGKLKITYYSDADVECIKSLFSPEQNVALDLVLYDQNKGDSEYPLDENAKDYSLNVYEIQQGLDFSSDFNGKYLLEIQQEQEGFSSFYSYSFVSGIDINDTDRLVKVAQKVNTTIAIAIDNTSHKIPEVRAGPIS